MDLREIPQISVTLQPLISKSYMTRLSILCFLTIGFCGFHSFAQKKVAFTIDDVPNAKKAPIEISSSFLKKIDSMQIPTTIFINEGKIKTSEDAKTLESWIKNSLVTPGNHTLKHARYSTTPLNTFLKEVTDGEKLSRALVKKYDKDSISL